MLIGQSSRHPSMGTLASQYPFKGHTHLAIIMWRATVESCPCYIYWTLIVAGRKQRSSAKTIVALFPSTQSHLKRRRNPFLVNHRLH
ncbi:hypothetical protein BD309DRAFT_946600 [Dichomitus squalens]|nr:hypothetical protein BD309DRAFT_946600 [Dichomitus squalens]